ncbi:MAG: DEAD/DEAH box helicase, partial [Oscillospiraceae bacterium]|nr:DEAD/DEAH box helicase [Oscillospiraceae bacterium]
AGSDILYVPVTQLDLVSKYIGSGETRVKLNKLGTDEWHKTRGRVKKAVAKMAKELIKLYAKRKNTEGFAFSKDNDWMANFEQHFEYEETDDQLEAISEIKKDMEANRPMDRLLCGDVGFGKTEVALRAAFKCVLDGKQCAFLCPTTILAWQHYKTTIARFGDFPVTVELLSRFKTQKQQQDIIKRLANGSVDMLIGTHRIVQNDVVFKNLGLAIVDEEQRFGVVQKERFKQIFNGVDVLSLSATPIPRTLNMAMSGIRDMSVLEQPPKNRQPIQTYVMEYNASVIYEAIQKELRRDGQVYYIHNKISSINLCAERIKNMLPDAKVKVAHSKMGEKELSSVWEQLLNHEIDILVCTTIIETGVDISNINTMIVENADRLGLSQLYQLRGRIGRSKRRAFAYFTFVGGKTLSEVATKRLTAIREFTRFGSGFKVA